MLKSTDGGGIRGLSSLYILKSIMTAVQSKEAPITQGPLYPYKYFDLIAGTSTGGSVNSHSGYAPADAQRLIAVMLGVLQMDIDSCINEYVDMAPKIFPLEGLVSRRKSVKVWRGVRGQARFDPAPFETAIKTLIVDHLKTRSSDGENTSLRFEASSTQQCKV